jgi:hypothetical protein
MDNEYYKIMIKSVLAVRGITPKPLLCAVSTTDTDAETIAHYFIKTLDKLNSISYDYNKG